MFAQSVNGDLPVKRRARRTNDPLSNFSTNTAQGRRLADLVRGYMRTLGNPSDVNVQAAVIAAAELQVLAEEVRAQALKEPATADIEKVVKLEGAAARAARRLGVGARVRAQAHVPLRERLARAAGG